MKDRDISAGTAIAAALWVVALVLLVATWIVDERRLAVTTLMVTGVAMTATIRAYFVSFTTMVRRAFQIDRDVTPLR